MDSKRCNKYWRIHSFINTTHITIKLPVLPTKHNRKSQTANSFHEHNVDSQASKVECDIQTVGFDDEMELKMSQKEYPSKFW